MKSEPLEAYDQALEIFKLIHSNNIHNIGY